MAAILPGKAIAVTTNNGRSEVLVHKATGGHFETSAKINGRELTMLVDTGASQIVLSHADARKIGIDMQKLEFNVPVSTAGGLRLNALTTLRIVSIGSISRHTVPALVSQKNELDQSLLGMSFLSSLASFQMSADELRLTDY
ncbi:TIGR02281 family clan AA aspartic protease [Rhizobium sp. 32-5/1]|uniref:TIGR02281 family clan AA aspartic protease n=1 Tax=Rhizobium sp. 32-5/1 TaxID=3019602 RepID=UPI00240D003C|nr:TIGR02281 family clan AA aspartic protease [Rhizobium sp. 32-5/1]WEZ84555.1 TIGR02281 family clan AA aspartic protease [Rhizobium sp. 32-5/1]